MLSTSFKCSAVRCDHPGADRVRHQLLTFSPKLRATCESASCVALREYRLGSPDIGSPDVAEGIASVNYAPRSRLKPSINDAAALHVPERARDR